MKLGKSKSLIGLVVVLALLIGTAYLFLQVTGAQQAKTERAIPSTSAILDEAPSIIATSPEEPPEEPVDKTQPIVATAPAIPKEPVHVESAVPLYTGPTLATGDDCTDPIVVSLPGSLPYSDLSQTTCGRMNDYEDPDQASCLYYYDTGEDIIYELDVSSAVDVDITMNPNGTTWSGIALDYECPPDADCIAYVRNSGSSPRVMSGIHLEPGTYYIMIDTWSTPDCITSFDLTITEPSGACCNDLEPYDCQMLTEAQCNGLPDHTFLGLGVTCGPPNPCIPPPENDNCEDAEAVGDVTDLAFSTTLATFDGGGTCMTSPNIWYCYTATCTGEVTVSLCGSSYDTKLAVYEGCECDPLGTQIECNDDYCGAQSEITFSGVEGNQYLIEVGGYSSYTGDGILNISCVGADQGACCNALAPYDCQLLTEPECNALSDHTFLGAGTNCGPPNPCPAPPPENDECTGAPIINTFPTTVSGTTQGATIDCPGVLDWDAVWYQFDLPYTSNDVFIDFCPTEGDIETVGVVLYDECPPDCPDYILRTGYQWVTCSNGFYNPQIWWDALPGPGSYWFPVYVAPGKKGAMDFSFEVSVTEGAAAPPNDDCANAEAVGDVTNQPFSTSAATFDGGGTCQYAPNIWYCYTATCSGDITVSLCGSSYDTKLAVYEGCECDPLGTEIECNDDYCGLQSEITFIGVQGNQYLIEVGGYSSNTGDGVLTISCEAITDGACCNDVDPYDCQILTPDDCALLPNHTFLGLGTDCGPPNPCLPGPDNDDCEGAPVINTFPTTMYGTTIGATIDCPGVLDWDAVWYRFDVPYATNNILVDYCPTDGYIATVGIVLYDECPTDCPGYIIASGYSWVSCPSGYSNPNIWWNDMPGPASYWFPVYVEPGKKGAMDFGFEVSVTEAVPCTVACPDGAIPEGEPDCYDGYVDTYNGGCNSSPYIWQNINCGDTICGTSGVYDANYYRDTDWFRVEVGDGALTWTCVAEFPLLIFVVDAGSENCSDYTILGSLVVPKCDTATLSFYVTSGVYWVLVMPSDWGNYPCGDLSEYVAWVDCTPFGPQMAVDPASMYPVLNPTGECSTATEDLSISSVGGEALTYDITENPPVDWMELSSYSGTLPPDETDIIEVSFDAGGMAEGDYYCDLEIDHNDPALPDPFVVAVHLEVELAPEIDMAPRLWMPVVPGCIMDQGFRVHNYGEGELKFEVSVTQNPPPLMAGKNNVREALEALHQAGRANPSLTPKEAYRTVGAKKSAIEYYSTGTSEGLLLSAGAGKQATILLVDDDGGLPGGTYTDVEYAYIDALDANGYVYDYYVVNWTDPLSDGPDLATMQNYSCVIWFCGETWGYYGDDTITDDDEVNLAGYLDGGGNLFLSAEDYLYESYPSAGSFYAGQFPYDYLHLQSVCQDCILDPYTVYGVTGSVADGMEFYCERCWNDPSVALWTDYLYTQAGAVDVFSVNYGDPSAIQYDAGTYKIVFTTTAFPGLVDGTTPSTKAELMASIMEWFGCVGPACPFTVYPEEGDIPAESFFDVTLTFDGTLFTECDDETLTCYLVFTSNDCDEPVVTVDVHAMSARGDVTGDCVINIADVVSLLNYLFKGCPAPDPLCIGDVDRDGDVDSDDALYLVSYLFTGGPPPEIPTAPKADEETIDVETVSPIKQTPIQQK